VYFSWLKREFLLVLRGGNPVAAIKMLLDHYGEDTTIL